MRIIVLGAGVVGLATAYRLARDGHSVTVLEGEVVIVGAMYDVANGKVSFYDTKKN